VKGAEDNEMEAWHATVATQGADKARHKVWMDPTNKTLKNNGEHRMQQIMAIKKVGALSGP